MSVEMSPRLQRLLAVGAGFLALLIVALFAVWPMWSAWSEHADQVSLLKRQAMAMRSLADAAPKFEALSKKLAAKPELQQLTYAAPQPTLAIAQLQGQLSQIFGAVQAVVTTSQPMPEERDGSLTKISVQSTIEADIKALTGALHAIDAARPLLHVDKLVIRDPDGEWAVAPQANQPNKLQVELVVSAYMRVP